MVTRSAVAAGLMFALVAVSSAQQNAVFTQAVPPDRTSLERLNLKTEWSLHVPIEGRHDSITLIQTFGDQLIVQTRTGLIGAIDAYTGKLQWWAQLGNGTYANTYPVAVNKDFVYAASVTTLYAFYRYTGVTEFVTDLGTSPTAGLVADDTGLYTVLAIRPGAGGAHRVAVYDLPTPIGAKNVTEYVDGVPKTVTPIDQLTKRYPTAGVSRTDPGQSFGQSSGSLQRVPSGGATASRSPSLSVTPTMTPPYSLDTGHRTPALTTVPSFRQPYRLQGENSQNLQSTPSVSAIPPSLAASIALSNLRPQGVKPPTRWEFGTADRILYTPLLSPLRLWGASDGRFVVAMRKIKVREGDKQIELEVAMPDQISASPAQAGTMGYFPVADGNVYAVELTGGDQAGGLNTQWRANVGGLMNRQPFVTEDAVYAAGDNSGVARLDRKTGELTWRSDAASDRVIAANKEFVYLLDRQGRMLVYAANRATDAAARRSVALSSINVPEFNVPVVNTASDRIILAAPNGLIVCLRDASPKYVRPMKISPEPIVNAPPMANVVPGMLREDPKPPPDAKADPKEPEKKEPPKEPEKKEEKKEPEKK